MSGPARGPTRAGPARELLRMPVTRQKNFKLKLSNLNEH